MHAHAYTHTHTRTHTHTHARTHAHTHLFLAPDDFTAISRQRVMFQASAAAQTSPVSVQIRMDGIVENTENFSGLLELDVSAERITANPSTANVMITDNDSELLACFFFFSCSEGCS